MFPSRRAQLSDQLQLGLSLHRSNIILKAFKRVRLTASESHGMGVVILFPYHMGFIQEKGITLKKRVKNRKVADWNVEGEFEEGSWVNVSKVHYIHVCNNRKMS